MQPKKSEPVPQQETPSALPDRPNNLMDSAVPSPNIQPARLYPSLDENIILNNISLGPDVVWLIFGICKMYNIKYNFHLQCFVLLFLCSQACAFTQKEIFSKPNHAQSAT